MTNVNTSTSTNAASPAASTPQMAGYHVVNATPGRPDPLGLAGNYAPGEDAFRSLRESMARRSLLPLPKRTEEMIDDAMIDVGLDRLSVARDLIEDASRRKALPNWMAVPTITAHKRSRAGRAREAFVPTPLGETDRQALTPYTLPIYVTFGYFEFTQRDLMAAGRVGYDLDTAHVSEATINVNEQVEDTTLNGGPNFDGNSVNGYLDTTNTQAYEGGTAWDNASKTGQGIVTDVINMNGVLETDRFFGAKDLYVNTSYNNALNNPWSDGTTTFDKTIRRYLEEMSFGGQNLRVRVADQLATNRTLLVDRTTPGVSRMIVGQQARLLSFDSLDGFRRHFYVIACMVPDIQSNSDGNFGICSGNTS